MNNLPQIFMYQGSQIRTVIKDNEPWWVAKDVCDVLEHSNASKAVKDLVDEDDLTTGYPIIDSLGRTQHATIINESGLFSLILSSRKPEAKTFKRWITHEVIPSIRKTGSYSVSPQLPQNYKEALLALVAKVEENEMLQHKIELDRPKVVFAESLEVSNDTILIGHLAKILKQNGINIGEIRLFEWMRENGYLIKSGSEKNMPTQRSMEMKLMEVKFGSRLSNSEGSKMTRTTKITGRGVSYFINKFKEKQVTA